MMQRKCRTRLFAACSLSSLAFASHAIAQDSPAYFTGPLLTSNAVTLPAGTWLIEPYLLYYKSNAFYDEQGNRHSVSPGVRQWQTSIPIYYGVTGRLQLKLGIGGAHAMSGGAHTDGIQATDTTVGAQYMLLSPGEDRKNPAVSLAYTHRFPTGTYDRVDQDPLNAIGNGANVDTFSALLQQYVVLPNGRPMRFRATVSYSLPPDPVTVRGMSAYGTPRGFLGNARLGSSLEVSTAVEYSINQRWVLAMDLAYDRDAASQVRGMQGQGKTAVLWESRSPSRDVFSLAPAVEYNFNDRIGVIGGVQLSFAGRNNDAFFTPMAAINMVF
ncbi:MAG TPA: transporter [Dyella sp.]|uniref:transporter n=1 Tax=Dyella sp. TaxID=1869338 RepID=UPI002B732FF1|nr:transporter [Dyella sp.]HTV83972.1 transporter [Dyella sp.]HUB46900.1 transporter [Acetobacteraceae bacterium]